jgi:UDP-N-acetylglucosamine 2-epimerase (non-hydrolysing)
MAERRLRVLSVFGTRPEAVKMAPVVLRLRQTPGVDSRVCVTAQHREMLDQVLALFDLKPDHDLDLMRPDQSLAELTASVFRGLDPVLEQEQPDWVLVQGDTTTVMATALLAYYHQVRVGHVEAGLRTGDKWRPFPEEINRRVASVVADLHFAPTDWARANLLREGIPEGRVVVTGNPVIDALQTIVAQPYDETKGPLAGVPADRRLILVTAHRRESFGRPLEDIFSAVRRVAETYASRAVILYPVHRNPNVREPAERILGGLPNVRLVDPLDYRDMAHCLQRAFLVLTDSGGLQEEAPALGTPVLVLRQVTERPEALQAGTARLVGTDPDRIVAEASRLMDDPQAHAAMARAANPYGDGHAAERIVAALLAASGQ